MVSAAAGLAMWVVAGRLLPPAELGIASSFLSAAMFVAGLSDTGVGPATLKWVARCPGQERRILATVYGGIVSLALVLGVLFWITPLAADFPRSPLTAVVFVTGCALWAVFAYQDYALTSLGRAAVAPVENLLQALVRIGLVLVLAPLLGALGVLLGWYIATVAGVVLVAFVVIRHLHVAGRTPRPSTAVPSYLTRRTVVSDLASAASATASLTILYNFVPVLVTYLAGPANGGVFFLLWAGFSVSDYASNGFANPMIVNIADRTARVGALTIKVLRRLLTLYSLGALLVIVLAEPLLRLLGREYAEAGTVPLRVLAVAAVLRAVVPVTVAAAMGRDKRRAVGLLHGFGLVAMLAAVLSASSYGLLELACSLLAVQVAQSAVCAVFLIHLAREDDAL